MAPSGPHRLASTAPRAFDAAVYAYAYGYRAWRFTQALGRPA
jgi:hypothetical protein